MFKTIIKQRPFLLCCIFVSFLFAIIQVSLAQAATQQTPTSQVAAIPTPTSNATITPTPIPTATATPMPTPTPGLTPTVALSPAGQNTPNNAVGHPGTKVSIFLRSFGAGDTVNLYTTATPDPKQCTAGASGVLPFTDHTRVTVDANGSLDLKNIPWPANANVAERAYYVCATTSPQLQAVSGQSFTVADPVKVTLSAPTVQSGNQITITGENWLPAQSITAYVETNQASGHNLVAQSSASSDNNGHFSLTLTIPANTAAGTYAIKVFAPNENTADMTFEQDNILTVSAGPVTPSATATPTPNVSTSNTGGSGLTAFIFVLGGFGVLFIIIGIIMFAASSPQAPAR